MGCMYIDNSLYVCVTRFMEGQTTMTPPYHQLTLLTLTQGNPIALERTFRNAKEKFGDMLTHGLIATMCPYSDDYQKIGLMRIPGVDIRVVELSLSHLFHHGFGPTFNHLVDFYSQTRLHLYLNVGEIIDSPLRKELITPQHNAYQFDHAEETHKWTRIWDKENMRWSGRIHEEIRGNVNLGPVLFTMADTEKDSGNPKKAWVYNDIKEMVYFYQYLLLVDDPKQQGATNQGWVDYAKNSYGHIKERLEGKGERLQHFIEGRAEKYLELAEIAYHESPEFKNTNMIHYQ